MLLESPEAIKPSRVFVAVVLLCGVVTFVTSCGNKQSSESQEHTGAPASAPLAVSRPPAEDGQWTMAAKDPSSSRYSGLDQITNKNVGGLKPVWSLCDGREAGA